MSRRIVFPVLAVFVGSVLIGWTEARLNRVDIALAACSTLVNCGGGDGTVTSALEVTHYYADGDTVVEPDDGEIFQIDAYWGTNNAAPFACLCSEVMTSVSADVTWTGSAWSVSCTGCNPTSGPIRSVSICDGGSCGSGAHAWSYTLIVDVDDVRGPFTCGGGPTFDRFLHRVEYNTTSIDPGDSLNTGGCTEVTAVNPSTQSVGAIDYGTFECAFNCNATAVPLGIYYE